MKINKFLLFFVGVLIFFTYVYSAPRLGPSVTKTSRNEGNVRSDIGISCSTTAWTSVLSLNLRRRDAVLKNLSTASYSICLSSSNTSATTCTSGTAGIQLEAGDTYTDYNEAILYCRTTAGGSATYIYGQEHYDNDDSSSFQ